MSTATWKTETIEQILPEEFFRLILANRSHIAKTFPVTLSNCSDVDKTSGFISENRKKQRNKDGHYFYLRDNETQSLIGYVCIKNVNKTIMKCELAYFIDKDFEGKGIISEAVAQTVAFCFGKLQMNKVFICTSKINTASQRIAQKLGFRQEGTLREEFRNGEGQLEDIIYFGLLKSDYHEK